MTATDEDGVRDARQITEESLYGGRLRLSQARRGYRFSTDALLLADDVVAGLRERSIRAARILDAGAGCGVVGLCVAARVRDAAVDCVERVDSLVTLCARNAAENQLAARVRVHAADLREWSRAGPSAPGAESGDLRSRGARCDAVAMNPPYFEPGSGRPSPNAERVAARQQVAGDLHELASAAVCNLATDGALHVVGPARAFATWLATLRGVGCRSVDLRFVHPFEDAPARLVVYRGWLGGRADPVKVRPPLVIYRGRGAGRRKEYGTEMRRVLTGDDGTPPTD